MFLQHFCSQSGIITEHKTDPSRKMVQELLLELKLTLKRLVLLKIFRYLSNSETVVSKTINNSNETYSISTDINKKVSYWEEISMELSNEQSRFTII